MATADYPLEQPRRKSARVFASRIAVRMGGDRRSQEAGADVYCRRLWCFS